MDEQREKKIADFGIYWFTGRLARLPGRDDLDMIKVFWELRKNCDEMIDNLLEVWANDGTE